MNLGLKCPPGGKNLLTILIGTLAGVFLGSLLGTGLLFGLLPSLELAQTPSFFQKGQDQMDASKNQENRIDFLKPLALESLSLAMIERNSLLPISALPIEAQPIRTMRVIITGYSSTPWETDEDPFITAAGTRVKDGVVANNYLPMGTKIRIPEIYGDKVFVIEDRMHWTKGNYQIDIWFPDYWQALNFGAKRTYIEVLES